VNLWDDLRSGPGLDSACEYLPAKMLFTECMADWAGVAISFLQDAFRGMSPTQLQ
jgi:hypothetical protein